ncbi:carboxymuconolactone decarboxylase family protein [Variovorax sp. J22P168]|uniref:carboxymuconolactone decarboxylase family protein n=1 Tax=Variovorax jilinensis TaxID=3053513 RepID=UPI0025753456|nr:carboxymuconolactone decarboxylase family protein [Variovorax sp. J22P168]MDM0013868.1 carboxymuconolactone decarboxylase family protein [Variovorax sp. J22P168]
MTIPQGHTRPWSERLPLPAADTMSEAQRAAAQALIDGPRKAVFGPFVPLLQSPVLMERIGSLGEYLRFDSALDARVRELVTCAVARHVGNQFEWVLHAAAAVKAGVDAGAIEALRLGRRTAPLADDEQLALDFAQELLRNDGVSEPTYAAAEARFGKTLVVELSALVGYFTMVCWIMNVAHTPVQAGQGQPGLDAFPL